MIQLFFGLFCLNSYGLRRSYFNELVDVNGCIFQRISATSGDGGVILISDVNTNMTIHNSVFFGCIANSGGAIYYQVSSFGRVTLRNICGCNCSSGTWHFAAVYPKGTHNTIIDALSVAYCSKKKSGTYAFCFYTCPLKSNAINSSNNYNNYKAALGFVVSTTSESSFCTYFNNSCNDIGILYLQSGKALILNSNFVSNTCTNNGLIYGNGATINITSSVFLMNSQIVLSMPSGTANVLLSYIDMCSSSMYSGSVSENKVECHVALPHTISHFHTIFCEGSIIQVFPSQIERKHPLNLILLCSLIIKL